MMDEQSRNYLWPPSGSLKRTKCMKYLKNCSSVKGKIKSIWVKKFTDMKNDFFFNFREKKQRHNLIMTELTITEVNNLCFSPRDESLDSSHFILW